MTADMKKLLLFLILVGAAIGWWQNPEFVRIYAEKEHLNLSD